MPPSNVSITREREGAGTLLSYCMTLLESNTDRERFTRIYRDNQRQMLRQAACILGEGPRAEDVVHDAFVKLIRCFDELRDRPEDRLSAWLLVVTKNNALDLLRRESRETELGELEKRTAAPAEDGEFYALVALIRRMPEGYRRILELRFVAEWSLADIAGELGISEGAVKSRIFRGRKLLIRALRKEGYLDGRACI